MDFRGRSFAPATLLTLLAIGVSLAFAVAKLIEYAPPGFVEPFNDGLTYLAAGERLRAGHDLYALAAGDRPILVIAPFWTAPLMYPPPIAVLYAPLSALGIVGLAVWIAACGSVLLTSTWVAGRRSILAAALVLALSPAIGEQLAVANVNALFVGALVLAWSRRGNPLVGVLFGVMAAIKLVPAVMGAWLIARRDWRALALMAVSALAVIGVALAVVGPTPFFDYAAVARTVVPQPGAPDGVFGAPVLSMLTVVVCGLGSMVLGDRPRASFSLAVIGLTFGTPILYPSGLVLLIPAIRSIPREVDAHLLARRSRAS